uniref:DUS-like FMN-binding domain-containing protein n=1 Tax=Meloidogyne javanica TaxID=6303 RepID=A0A915N7T2_MELJA
MITSVICSLAVIYSYVGILLAVFGIDFGIEIAKKKLYRKEAKILSLPETTEFDERSIRYIAGIDLSASTNHPSFGVVGLTVMAYPSMKVVYCADEPVLLSALGGVMPYLPEYFAIREAKPLLRVIRRCGLACHIGYELGIPTIGVAKKLNEAPLLYSGYCTREDLAEINSEIYDKCDDSEGSATIEDQENNDDFDQQQCVPLFVAAPMVRYSKLPFRRLVKKYGCDIVYTPMIYADCFIKSEKCRAVEFVPSEGDIPIVQFAAKNAEDFAGAAELAEYAGISHITVHARTVEQRNEPPNYDSIATIKQALNIPVFANGNCKTRLEALNISKLTKADGVMAANGLLENPALFSGYLKTPKQCVLNWLEIENEENLSFEYFHQILVFML